MQLPRATLPYAVVTLGESSRSTRSARNIPEFEITMGGYDREEVDHLVTTVEAARDGSGPETRQYALEAVQMRKSESFRRKFRGYSKIQVRNYVEDRLREISRSA